MPAFIDDKGCLCVRDYGPSSLKYKESTMRITTKDLATIVTYLNNISGFSDINGVTVGAYRLDYAYGGVSLYRYVNDAGGVSDVFKCGHVTKRDLFYRIAAYIEGLHKNEPANNVN